MRENGLLKMAPPSSRYIFTIAYGGRPWARASAKIPPVDVPAKRSTLARNPGLAASRRSMRTAVMRPRRPPPSRDKMLYVFLMVYLLVEHGHEHVGSQTL